MTARWLLLIHQIPPKPDYLRVKVGRRLARIGAVAIKNSVYVLPAGAQAAEDFQWVRREIVDAGGEAAVCEASFVDGLTDAGIEQLFRDARTRDYDEIARDARSELDAFAENLAPPTARESGQGAQARADDAERRTLLRQLEDILARSRARYASVQRIDFFSSPERRAAEEALDAIERFLRPPASAAADGADSLAREAFAGRVWVTRRDVFVDRIASAWLIRRFIDPAARFRFVAPEGHRRAVGEVRFDMFDGEFTHEGDRCTFETLATRFGLTDPALGRIAEIVHDIDLRDGKFDHPDAPGIERIIAGLAAAHPDDAARVARGEQLFDDLYAAFREENQKQREGERA